MSSRRPFHYYSASLWLLLACGTALFSQERPRKDPAVFAGPGAAQIELRALPPSRANVLRKPGSVMLGGLSAVERSRLGAVGSKRRIGVHRELPEDSLDRGAWTLLADGRSIWQLAIRSDDAEGLRIHFSEFSIGAGKVWVHSGNSVDGPYTGDGPYGNGDFWSSTVEGESVAIEYEAAPEAGVSTLPPFHVRSVAHQALRVTSVVNPPAALILAPLADLEPGRVIDSAASCNLDVQCYAEWQDSKRSVAQLQFEETQGVEKGTFVCSGSLVATRDNTFKPYLLTAGHCIHDEAAARSLQTFWAYESSGCNQGPPSGRGALKSSNGGHLLAWGDLPHGDYSLVLLPDVPPGVVFAGWDTTDPDLQAYVTGIHHPMGSYKRVSFGKTLPSLDVNVGDDRAPAELYTIVGYNKGITQPGSSGSPLFSGPGVVVGMLTYGPALPGEKLCLIGDIGGYGKFSNAYPNLRDYLEDFPFSIVTPSTNSLAFTGLNHAITGATVQTVTLSVPTDGTVSFRVSPDAGWLHVSAYSGDVSASTPFKFQVSVDPRYLVKSDTYTTTIAILSGAAPPQYINVRVDMRIETSNVTVSAIPSPVPRSGGVWSLKLHLEESNGTPTKLTELRIDAVDYTSSIVSWFGTDVIEASGSIEATISTSGLFAPVDKYFEFFGKDVASGQTWYRTLTVRFTQ